MKLSIIIPIYNSELWIEDCLNSVLDNSMSEDEMEVLCVNDGSTDGTGELLNHFKSLDSRIHVFEKTNGGMASAQNVGIDYATGKYCIFINSDDYIDKESFTDVIDYMEKEHIDIYHGGTLEVPSNSHYNGQYHKFFSVGGSKNKAYSAPGDAGMTIYRTELIKSTAGTHKTVYWDEKAGAFAEYLFYDFVSKNSKNETFGKYPVYYHRVVKSSLGHNNSRKSKIQKMESAKYIASIYKNVLHYSVASRMAIQTYLISAISVYQDDELKNAVKVLEKEGLYPYKIIWRNLKPVITTNKICLKLTFINWSILLFPIKWYYYLYAKVFSKKLKAE